MENIQAMFKFCLMYQIEGVFELCLEWVRRQLELNNFPIFHNLGVLVQSIEREDVLKACKELILRKSTEDLLQFSKSWSDDEGVMRFLFNEDLLPCTLPVITEWIDCERKVVLALDDVEEMKLEETLGVLFTHSLQFTAKMNEVSETVPTLKRVNALQGALANRLAVEVEPARKRLQPSTSFLESLRPQRWRSFNKYELLALNSNLDHFVYAEILIDWIRFTSPAQLVVDELWRSIRQQELSCGYLYSLRVSIMVLQRYVLPGIREQGTYKYQSLTFDNNREIKTELQKGLKQVGFSRTNCNVDGCNLTTNHRTIFQLSDNFHGYQLGVEEPGDDHYHHDIIKHYYAREVVGGHCILLSFVSNTLEEVLDKIKDSPYFELHYLF